MSEWISVKDRLPEHAQMALVYVEWERMFDAWYANDVWYESNKDSKMMEFDGVTHWMPLPDPPIMPPTDAQIETILATMLAP